jgi:DNA-directed RNA polymerase I, II, and III subunit RPABC2
MDVDEYVPSDTEDIIASDIEDIDDASVDASKPVKKNIVPIPDDEDDDIVDDDDDSMMESDIDIEDDDDDDDDEIVARDDQRELAQSRFMMDDDDEEDDEEEDDDYLQKFNDVDKHDIITNFHPELYNHNYEEIQTLSKVARDNNGTVIDPLHMTLPFVTKYEKARILGERAKQLNAGAQSFVEVDDNVIDGYLIALKEFEEKKVPFIIKRPLPNGGCEYWKLSDLEILV